MKNEQAEPLIELLYQEFPNKDPIEIERIIHIVKKWLELILKERKEAIKTIEKDSKIKIEPLSQGHIILLMELIHKLAKETTK